MLFIFVFIFRKLISFQLNEFTFLCLSAHSSVRPLASRIDLLSCLLCLIAYQLTVLNHHFPFQFYLIACVVCLLHLHTLLPFLHIPQAFFRNRAFFFAELLRAFGFVVGLLVLLLVLSFVFTL